MFTYCLPIRLIAIFAYIAVYPRKSKSDRYRTSLLNAAFVFFRWKQVVDSKSNFDFLHFFFPYRSSTQEGNLGEATWVDHLNGEADGCLRCHGRVPCVGDPRQGGIPRRKAPAMVGNS